jgi:RNA polymerase primary sigma factor
MKRQIVITKSFTNLSTQSFKQYLNDISKIDKFESPEEEAECAIKAINGDKLAKDELVMKNLRFVVSVAKKYESQSASLPDLVNQGNIGLIQASNKFDPSKGYKFISYAVWWIRREILDYFYNSSRAIRIPTNKIGAMNKFKEATSKLVQEEGLDLTANDMYGKLEGFTDGQIDSMIEIDNLNVLSYDKKISSSDGDTMSMLDLMESSSEATDHITMDRDKVEVMESLLSKLNPTQKQVIKKYFGIGYNSNPMSLSEISNELGLSRERIRMIKLRALKTLKRSPKALELNDM